MLSSSMGCSEVKLSLRKLELSSCRRVRNATSSVCPRRSDSSGLSAELYSELSFQLNMHFTSGKVSSHFLQQKKNSLLFLADAEMIHHKSSSFSFQDHLMHSSVAGLWSLVCLKSSSFPAIYLAKRRVCWNTTQANKEEAVC